MTWSDTMSVDRFTDAASLAARLHQHQLRKGTQIPYLSHLLAVAALVAEDNGSENEVLAALLHDAAEDQGGEAALEEITAVVGANVASIVRECSDSLSAVTAEKLPWRVRKQRVVDQLDSLSPSALHVIAADKLHNTRATRADLEAIGPAVWDRFKTGREGFLWYHHQVVIGLQRRIPSSRSVRLLVIELSALTNTQE